MANTTRTLLTPLSQGRLPQRSRNTPARHRKSWGYQDMEGNYFLGSFPTTEIPPHPSDTLYVVEATDAGRPDLIAYKLYKDPAFYWIILWLNNISDPFEGIYPGALLRIPALTRLTTFGVLG